jgi:glutaredoxin
MEEHKQTDNTIVIYSSPTCGFCYMVKDYLKSKGHQFTEKDISTDQDALRFVLDKVGQAVTPIIAINDKIIVGFDRTRIDEALKS